MAITRARTSSVAQGPSTRKTVLGGNDVILPGSYEYIDHAVVGAGGATSVSFTSIPGTYKHLQVRTFAKNTLSNSYTANFYMRFNGDSSTNYNAHAIYGTGTAAVPNIPSGTNPVFAIWGISGSLQFGANIFDILDYSNTNKFKTVKCLMGTDTNGGGIVGLESGAWRSTSAITSITISMAAGDQTIAQYSHFALYGIK